MYNYVMKYHFYNPRNGKNVDQVLDEDDLIGTLKSTNDLIKTVDYQTPKAKSGYVHLTTEQMLTKPAIDILNQKLFIALDDTRRENKYNGAWLDPIEGLHLIKQRDVAAWIQRETMTQHPTCKWIKPYVAQIRQFQKVCRTKHYYFNRMRPEGNPNQKPASVKQFVTYMQKFAQPDCKVIQADPIHVIIVKASNDSLQDLSESELRYYAGRSRMSDDEGYNEAYLKYDYWRDLSSVMNMVAE